MNRKTAFVCQECGDNFSKWSGQCSNCSSWNSLTESIIVARTKSKTDYSISKLSEIKAIHSSRPITTNLSEFDRVLGGGIFPGMAILIGGDPGIGKSTLLTQVLGNLSVTNKVLYVSGEESLSQVSLRASRISMQSGEQYILSATALNDIIINFEKIKPSVVVIDSIQTIFSTDLTSAPGSVSQVRECASKLIQFAKTKLVTLFIVGHVTKDGSIAGPRVLEHMVDTVLYFEGSDNSRYRLLRTTKNRFGPANELGVFAMTEQGLQAVNNPSAIFLSQFIQGKFGTMITAVWEGSRTILVELQALVDQSQLSNPRRVCVGVDHNRISMLLAILNRHASVVTSQHDVYINVVGGIKINETAADLAIALAIYSSLKGVSIKRKAIILGELGLSGEIRPIQHGQERLQEAAKVGFELAIIPKKNKPKNDIPGLEVTLVDTILEAINVFRM